MKTLPHTVEALLESALVAEFTVLDPEGRPIVHPMLLLPHASPGVAFQRLASIYD